MLNIKINNISNFPLSTKNKILQAVSRLIEIINSKEFEEEFLKLQFSTTNGLNNQQILELIKTGKDIYEKTPDWEIDLNLNYYYRRWSRVIGYTVPQSNNLIYCNGYQYSRMGVNSIAANIFHEYLHLCGFIDPSVDKIKSVPYLAGNLVERLF